jgi:regulator of protease activity HflC (stomatin/prohibitin superfamily)
VESLSQVSVQNEIRTYRMTESGEGFIGAAVSADSQPIFMDVVVDYSLVPDKAVALYRITGGHFVERKLDPAVPQLAKEVTANYKAIDFAKNRERIRQQIQQRLTHDLLPLGIRINTISLRNVDFTPALKEAIEQTVEAEQQAKRAQAQVATKEAEAKQAIAEAAGQAQAGIERAQGEATANITRARGEATANRLRKQNLTAAVLQHEAIDKLNPKVQVIVCPPRTICIPNGSNVVPSP